MREQPPPFAWMAIRRHELQMVTGISFMRTGQSKSKMLLLLRQFLRLGRLRDTEIVHPENAALALLKCRRLTVRSRWNDRSQKFRHGLHLQLIAFGKGHSACVFESFGDQVGFKNARAVTF